MAALVHRKLLICIEVRMICQKKWTSVLAVVSHRIIPQAKIMIDASAHAIRFGWDIMVMSFHKFLWLWKACRTTTNPVAC
jgi:hypothetical protein